MRSWLYWPAVRCTRPQRKIIPSASWAVISAQAIAATTPIRSAKRPRQVARPGAPRIRSSTRAANRSPAATKFLEGSSDAHRCPDDSYGRIRPCLSNGPRSNLRSVFSGLSACLWPGDLLRVPLHLTAAMQRLGIRPRGAMRHQSVLCVRRVRAAEAACRAAIRRETPIILKRSDGILADGIVDLAFCENTQELLTGRWWTSRRDGNSRQTDPNTRSKSAFMPTQSRKRPACRRQGFCS